MAYFVLAHYLLILTGLVHSTGRAGPQNPVEWSLQLSKGPREVWYAGANAGIVLSPGSSLGSCLPRTVFADRLQGITLR